MKEVEAPAALKTDSVIRLLQEKICRDFGLIAEEVQTATITIKGYEITIKKGK